MSFLGFLGVGGRGGGHISSHASDLRVHPEASLASSAPTVIIQAQPPVTTTPPLCEACRARHVVERATPSSSSVEHLLSKSLDQKTLEQHPSNEPPEDHHKSLVPRRFGTSAATSQSSVSRVRSQSLGLQSISDFIQLTPVVMCVLNSYGAILAGNNAFQNILPPGSLSPCFLNEVITSSEAASFDAWRTGIISSHNLKQYSRKFFTIIYRENPETAARQVEELFEWTLAYDVLGIHVLATAVKSFDHELRMLQTVREQIEEHSQALSYPYLVNACSPPPRVQELQQSKSFNPEGQNQPSKRAFPLALSAHLDRIRIQTETYIALRMCDPRPLHASTSSSARLRRSDCRVGVPAAATIAPAASPIASSSSSSSCFEELKETKEEKKKLQELLETKRLFVRHTSHEIRTPLGIVLSGLEVLGASLSPFSDECRLLSMLDIIIKTFHCCRSGL